MGSLLLSILLLVVLVWMQGVAGFWLPFQALCLVPVLLVTAAVRMGDVPLVMLVVLGGLVDDFLVPDAPGYGPLIWAVVVMMVRSQRIWLRSGGMLFRMAVCVAATFVYLVMDRLAYMAAHGFWSWDERVTLYLVLASGVNLVAGPLLMWMLVPLFPYDRSLEEETV
jgi:hypothetical protein